MAKIAKITDPITGPYPELAQIVRRILMWDRPKDRLTLKAASTIAGVSASSIGMMANGERPSMELIIDFACGMDVDPNPLLRAVEYPEIEDKPTEEDIFIGEIISQWVVWRCKEAEIPVIRICYLLGFDDIDGLFNDLQPFNTAYSFQGYFLLKDLEYLLGESDLKFGLEEIIQQKIPGYIIKIRMPDGSIKMPWETEIGIMDRKEASKDLPRDVEPRPGHWPDITPPLPAPDMLEGPYTNLAKVFEDSRMHGIASSGPLSIVDIAKLTTLDRRTIGAMTCGFRPTEQALLTFARAFSIEPISFLKIVGYEAPSQLAKDFITKADNIVLSYINDSVTRNNYKRSEEVLLRVWHELSPSEKWAVSDKALPQGELSDTAWVFRFIGNAVRVPRLFGIDPLSISLALTQADAEIDDLRIQRMMRGDPNPVPEFAHEPSRFRVTPETYGVPAQVLREGLTIFVQSLKVDRFVERWKIASAKYAQYVNVQHKSIVRIEQFLRFMLDKCIELAELITDFEDKAEDIPDWDLSEELDQEQQKIGNFNLYIDNLATEAQRQILDWFDAEYAFGQLRLFRQLSSGNWIYYPEANAGLQSIKNQNVVELSDMKLSFENWS